MDHDQYPTSSQGGAIRASLACVPCRTRHVRCDASRPACRRCLTESKQCRYAESRRGGLTRAALAARRNLTATELRTPSLERVSDSAFPQSGESQPQNFGKDPCLSLDTRYLSQVRTTSVLLENARPGESTNPTDLWPAEPLNISKDPCIDLYYKHFHRCHPCVLPRQCLERLLQDTTKQKSLRPLISVMRFVGSLYCRSEQANRLREEAASICTKMRQHSRDPFMVQCHLIISIALYWCGEAVRSREEMDRAIRLALDLNMQCRQFAVTYGQGDLVLQESWRRTWWQIYIVDAYYAAMKHASTYPAYDVDVTTELPCEENEYEYGAIPVPKTLEDFDSREFSADNYAYSSFAYLIGAIRGVSLALSTCPSAMSDGFPSGTLEMVDTVIEGWLLLLPKSKCQILSKNGESDEMMFQANMAIHAATVGIHRQFSELSFDPMEIISSCAPTPPLACTLRPGEYETLHTARCLKSIEAQIRLLALPMRQVTHTPFVVCMLATGTISLLAACKFYLSDQRVAIARHQIRMSIGHLKLFANVWPQAERSLQEIQTIAREVLSQPSSQQNLARPAEAEPTSDSSKSVLDSDVDLHQGSSAWGFPPLPMEDLQADFNLSDLCTDAAWLAEY